MSEQVVLILGGDDLTTPLGERTLVLLSTKMRCAVYTRCLAPATCAYDLEWGDIHRVEFARRPTRPLSPEKLPRRLVANVDASGAETALLRDSSVNG